MILWIGYFFFFQFCTILLNPSTIEYIQYRQYIIIYIYTLTQMIRFDIDGSN